MEEQTDMIEKPSAKFDNESRIGGVSLRGWLAVMLTLTVCALSSWGREIKEPLYSAFLFVMGMYFGKQYGKPNSPDK